MANNTTKIDNLKEDKPIDRQNYVCLSFLSPEGIRNCSIRGLKIRGVYPTREEADARAKELQEVDKLFDVFVGEVGKWLPWDPDPNDGAKDQVYYEQELQTLMEGHEDNLKKSKRMHEQRRSDMLENAATEDHQTTDRNNAALDRVRKVYEKKKQDEAKLTAQSMVASSSGSESTSAPVTIPTSSSSNKKKKKKKKNKKKKGGSVPVPAQITELVEQKVQEEIATKERERLTDIKESIDTHKQNVESIDQKMAKIQSLYKKLQSKEDKES